MSSKKMDLMARTQLIYLNADGVEHTNFFQLSANNGTKARRAFAPLFSVSRLYCIE